jgi:hypothetical protein
MKRRAEQSTTDFIERPGVEIEPNVRRIQRWLGALRGGGIWMNQSEFIGEFLLWRTRVAAAEYARGISCARVRADLAQRSLVRSLGSRGAERNRNMLLCFCNTPSVCHSLSSGFELKHDRLSGDDNVKVNLWR